MADGDASTGPSGDVRRNLGLQSAVVVRRVRRVLADTLGLGLLVWAAATASAQGLGLTLATSEPIHHASETLSVTVGAESPGLPGRAGFYLAVLLPDGSTLVSIGPGGARSVGSVGNLAGLTPLAVGVSEAPFSVTVPGVLQHPWAGTEPLGSYQLFFAAVRAGALADGRLDAGDLLGLETLAVTHAPPLLPSLDAARAASAPVPPSGGREPAASRSRREPPGPSTRTSPSPAGRQQLSFTCDFEDENGPAVGTAVVALQAQPDGSLTGQVSGPCVTASSVAVELDRSPNASLSIVIEGISRIAPNPDADVSGAQPRVTFGGIQVP
jgi:hypothetical protein